MSPYDNTRLTKNLNLIKNIVFKWGKLPEKHPLTMRNIETGEEMDAWKVVLDRIENSLRTLEKLVDQQPK